MPDMDIDFDDVLREDVIDYCRTKYGSDKVSRIITFMTSSAKTVIRDVAKILYSSEMDKNLGTVITKLIPKALNITIDKALEESPELNKLYKSDKKVQKVIDISKIIEGLPKAISQHACGVIISDKSLYNYCPQVFIEDEDTGIVAPTTQFVMSECEEIGLLKMDFLGLKTMSILRECVTDINNIYGKDMKIADIPINDVESYKTISKGKTTGVFQLESAGMKSFMTELYQDINKKIKIVKDKKLSKIEEDEELERLGDYLFERLVAGISLYRPGPIDEIPNYIKNMINPDSIVYDTKELEDILNVTYGIIVYQEQVMATVRQLAGFSRGQADTIRKAMSKKIKSLLNEYKEYFLYGSGDKIDKNTGKPLGIKGCISLGIDKDTGLKIWDKMDKFSRYAFNKSHALGYAVVSIRTAWCATHYPMIFMKANLNAFITNNDKLKPYLAYCNRENIKLLPPSINNSNDYFSIEGEEEGIRFGLMALNKIKNLSQLILTERQERGLFLNFEDFVKRMTIHQKLNKGQIETLVYSGALDEFEGTRKAKVSIIDVLIERAKMTKKNISSGQLSLFDLALELDGEEIDKTIKDLSTVKTPDMKEFEMDILLEKEKESAGIYITAHPLDFFEKQLRKSNIKDISELKESVENSEEGIVKESLEGQKVSIAGIITETIYRYTAKGDMFVTFTVEDRTSELGVVCFTKQLDKNRNYIEEGKKVIITGKFSVNDFGPQIIVDNVIDLEHHRDYTEKIFLYVDDDREMANNQYRQITNYLVSKKNIKGETSVIFVQKNKKVLLKFKIDLNLDSLSFIQNILGSKNVILNEMKKIS